MSASCTSMAFLNTEISQGSEKSNYDFIANLLMSSSVKKICKAAET